MGKTDVSIVAMCALLIFKKIAIKWAVANMYNYVAQIEHVCLSCSRM